MLVSNIIIFSSAGVLSDRPRQPVSDYSADGEVRSSSADKNKSITKVSIKESSSSSPDKHKLYYF